MEVLRAEPRVRGNSKTTIIIGFYGFFAAVAVILCSLANFPIHLGTSRELAIGTALGAGIALIVVAWTRVSTWHFAWAKTLHQEFRSVLGGLTGREALVLAILSAVGEELLFRACLQSWIGLWPQAFLFGLLHIGPAAHFLPWTIASIVLGAAFGLLYVETGTIFAPIVAHFLINALNLRHILARRVA